jgi:hypothetical protein
MNEENSIEDGSQEPEDRSQKSESLREDASGEIPKSEITTTTSETGSKNAEEEISKSEINTMEVHHHPQLEHKAKPWKEYLLEGLMIFLAVTLGFFAENYREHITETHRENEFARTLYAELRDDSIVAASKLALRHEKEKDMDYLSSYFKDSALSNLPPKVYPAFTTSLYLINSYTFDPKDGMLSQLRNSGSLRYFKSIELQKLLGDISVNINTIRARNDQEYQYFANPIKPFMLNHFDWKWLDDLRKQDTSSNVLDVINNYRNSSRNMHVEILNIASFDRGEAANLILFYKQMLVSTRTLQLNNYIITNRKILQLLRENYSLENE